MEYVDRSDSISEYLNRCSFHDTITITNRLTADGDRIITILNNHSIAIEIYLAKSNYCLINAGLGFNVNDVYWPNFPAIAVLEYLINGNLREKLRMLGSRCVGVSSNVLINNEEIYSNRTRCLLGEALHLVTKTTSYVQYPSLVDSKASNNQALA
ncbi:hypothetical protein [Herpetosiphon geysericola]|uniref:Uncharacterized protein n=1 Tax=Herpetosiphon geysericola TaxID=70996 RepID=A0A0P6XJQ1_9CHLR|nr:hypothetical protein [Herpetosiphon geysericola]KPL80318.1 hypothetical protein SE18_25070 [Herpetosiphon geysericola]